MRTFASIQGVPQSDMLPAVQLAVFAEQMHNDRYTYTRAARVVHARSVIVPACYIA